MAFLNTHTHTYTHTHTHTHIYRYIYIYLNFHHTTCESMCDTLTSSAANQDDNIVSVAQGGATETMLSPLDGG